MSRPLLARLFVLGMAGTMLAPVPAFAKHAAAASSTSSDANDPVIARVNGDAIRRSDVMLALQQMTPPNHQPTQDEIQKLYPKIRDDLIARKLAYQEGIREGLQNSSDVKHAETIADQQIIEQAFIRKAAGPAITDENLHKAYDEATRTPQEEVHVRHILVKTEDEAKDIIKQLDAGGDFQKIAKEKSIDTDNAKDGGDLGFFTKGSMDPGFTDAAFSLQPGSYTKTPVKTRFGYDVIQSVEKRQAKTPTFEEAKAQLQPQVAQRAIQQRLVELAKTAKIDAYNMDGSPLKPQTAPAEAAPAPAANPAPATDGAPLQLPQTSTSP